MRISSKLAAVVLAVFVIVGTVGAVAVDRLLDVARISVESEARTLAATFANMAAYQIADAGAERAAQFQRITDFIGVRQQRDLSIIGRDLVILADVAPEDIGKRLAPGMRGDAIARTLDDGLARLVTEPARAQLAAIREVVVPIYDKRQHITAALVYEYTPLYDALVSRGEKSLRSVAAAALIGLLLALGCAAFIARRVSVPLAHLSAAALQLAQGRRDVTVDASSNDEIGDLAKVFNTLSAALLTSEERLSRLAQIDPLTALANRAMLMDRLTQAVADARRRRECIVIAFIDLDGFKGVNDSLGHECGDLLLQTIARRLTGCVRASDTVARLGGDEFVILLPNQNNAGQACAETFIAQQIGKLVEAIGAPVPLAGSDVVVSCSIGVALFPQDGADADTLLKHADTAMYRAKELGKNGYQFFTAQLQRRANQQLELAASLRLALERDEFELHYQPQVSLRSGKVIGVEALLRWRHPEQGLVGPAHFIAFAEETGLIIPIGEWVLMRACAQNRHWQERGLAAIPVAVNVSAKQCAHPDLEAVVRRALEHSGLPAHLLELELTESISMADPEQSVPMMQRMKRIGVMLSIDDFGTGYSNMSYLRRFPIDRLKLDISFVRDITTDPSSLAIADAIIAMSHTLNIEVVAEGVETEGQLALLASRDCDIVQGYFFSKPLPVAQLEQLLHEGRRLPAALTGRPGDAPAILVLDDDALILDYLQLVLGGEGYTVYATADPLRAFELLACHETAVLLCDQRMPAMTGIEFVSRVRHMYPDTVRIMLSAYDDAQVTRQAINMGAVYKFIEKSADHAELREVVDDAFRRYLARRPRRLA
ncbi:MAG: EAL domain-containing protein [Pseudomonadota bacterium]|nr:EAL domain-containing protein [Pseudomonadota bacterium]